MNHRENYLKFKIKEEEFANAIREYGEIELPTQDEDINEHWDIQLTTKFDVKAVRKVNRQDNSTDETIHWVELKNVHGKPGWLYGKADKIAFELDEYWLIVDKFKLQNFIANKCKDKILTNKPELYKLYNRKDREDLITLVKTIDLIYIADNMIKK